MAPAEGEMGGASSGFSSFSSENWQQFLNSPDENGESSTIHAPAEGEPPELYPLPSLDVAPTDVELVKHLHRMLEQHMRMLDGLPAPVNHELCHVNPWELPGIAHYKHGKQFVTNKILGPTKLGFWKNRDGLGWVIPDKGNDPVRRFIGLKRTYNFCLWDPRGKHAMASYWFMNVYSTIDDTGYVKRDLVLCHVFENKSADYDPRPECAEDNEITFDKVFGWISVNEHSCDQHPGKSCNDAPHGGSPTNMSSGGTTATTWSFETINKHLLSDDEKITAGAKFWLHQLFSSMGLSKPAGLNPDGDHALSRKRTRSTNPNGSSVWLQFTKLFDTNDDGKVSVLAACNHCCKALVGDSKKGTSHLHRHLNQHKKVGADDSTCSKGTTSHLHGSNGT